MPKPKLTPEIKLQIDAIVARFGGSEGGGKRRGRGKVKMG